MWQLIKDWPAAASGREGWEVALFAWICLVIIGAPLVLLLYVVTYLSN